MTEGFWNIDREHVGSQIRDSIEGISDMSLGDVLSRAETRAQETSHGSITEWLIQLSADLDRIGYRVSEEYPAAGREIKTLGRQASEWVARTNQ